MSRALSRAGWPVVAVSVALSLAVSVAGCTAGDTSVADPAPTASPSISPSVSVAPAGLDAEATDAWNRWQQLGWDDYTYRLTVGCFCPTVRSVPIEVQDGEVVTYNGKPYPDMKEIVGFGSKQPTVAQLFSVLGQAQMRAHEVTVRFHDVTGVPTGMWVDWDKNMIDEEISYSAVDVTQN